LFFSFSGTRSVRSDFDLLSRGAERLISFTVLLCAAHVANGVGEGNARFRHADEFNSLLRCDGERQCFRIRKSDIFAREDDNAARDEAGILAGV